MDIQNLYNNLADCDICPRECRVNRFEGEDGTCGCGSKLIISSYGPHYGEEPEIVGLTFSGTIFLSGCSLLCNFCQNYQISHLRDGRRFSEPEIIDIMLSLQENGASNINFVTPTHFSPQLIKAVHKAKNRGLHIPIVYNSGGYDKVETLKYWEGAVDIYMPDLKFKDPELSRLYTGTEDYFLHASKAIKEMHRQTGDLEIVNGTAVSGLLIRHLIMPGHVNDTKDIIDFIHDATGPETYLNLMEQYHPAYKACEYPGISRRITPTEYSEAVNYARSLGFTRPDYIFG